MKVDFTAPINDVTGKQMMAREGDSVVQMTLGAVALAALLNDPAEERPPVQEKLKRWLLAQKIQEAGEKAVDLKSEEVVLLRDLIGERLPTMVVGRAFALLPE